MHRYADTYRSKCAIHAAKHAECINENSHWEPDNKFEYMAFLKEFDVFAKHKKTVRTPPCDIPKQGIATVVSLGGKDRKSN